MGDVGQDEEAFEHAKQALDIWDQLAKKNPDRHEPDFATSLSNYANRLGDVGQDEEALEYAKRALDIWAQLTKKNPNWYEPDFATSLSNYANRLGDVGQDDEAFKHATQSLNIRKKLAEKNPDRHSKAFFNSQCNTAFTAWLCNASDVFDVEVVLRALPVRFREHERSLYQLYAAFVLGCRASSPEAREALFGLMLPLLEPMSHGNRQHAMPYWLCAAVWCNAHTPTPVAQVDWLTHWRRYIQRRKDKLPHWMREVAKRLEFSFPQG